MDKIEEKSILNYLSNIPFVYREELSVPKDMNFGAEIEFMTYKQNEVIKKFNKLMQEQKKNGNIKYYRLTDNKRIVKYNSGKKIIELKTPVLSNNKEDFVSLKNMCLTLSENTMPSNQKGIHVHANMSLLEDNSEYLETLLKLFCVYEHILFRFSYGEEEESNINLASYSREISNRLYKYLKKTDLNQDFNKTVEELRTLFNCKSYAINFHEKDLNCKSDTIEVRTFNSSFNPVIIQNDINLVLSMVESIRNNNVDLDRLNYRFNEYDKGFYVKEKYSNLNLDDAIEFSDHIYSKNIDKDYFLRQYAIKDKPKQKKLVI